MLTINIKTDNAAFEPNEEDESEITEGTRMECARILREIARKLDSGHDYGTIHDHNGNRVGEWSL